MKILPPVNLCTIEAAAAYVLFDLAVVINARRVVCFGEPILNIKDGGGIDGCSRVSKIVLVGCSDISYLFSKAGLISLKLYMY